MIYLVLRVMTKSKVIWEMILYMVTEDMMEFELVKEMI
jgi:hypothetical protein